MSQTGEDYAEQVQHVAAGRAKSRSLRPLARLLPFLKPYRVAIAVALVALLMVRLPVVDGSFLSRRKLMNLSSSFDHRIVDGYDAASFIQRLKRLMEHPALIFID